MVTHRVRSKRQTPVCSRRGFVTLAWACAVSLELGGLAVPCDAESAWLTSRTNLASVTVASGIVAPAMAVPWKDTCFDTSRPTQSFGDWESVLVSAPRSVPPSEFSALLSFASPVGTGLDRLPAEATLLRAQLWLKIEEVRGSFTLRLLGLPAADGGWMEAFANLAFAQPGSPWSQGSPRRAGESLGSFESPTRPGWFAVPVDLVPLLEGVRRGEWGGLLLVADAPVSAEPRLLRWLSKDAPAEEATEVLLVEWEAPSAAPNLSRVPSIVSTHSARGLLHLRGADWQRVELDGAEMPAESPGQWTLVLSLGPHQLRVTNPEGSTLRSFEVRTTEVQLQVPERRPGGVLRLQWSGAEGWEYLVESRPDPSQSWSILSRVAGSNGVMRAEYSTGLHHNCFRVLANAPVLDP